MATITLSFEQQEIETIGIALGQMPFVRVSALIMNINKQIQEQQQPQLPLNMPQQVPQHPQAMPQDNGK